jgi:hypothetical protein
MYRTLSFSITFSFVLGVTSSAGAQSRPAAPAPPREAPLEPASNDAVSTSVDASAPSPNAVGGHVGVATSIVTVSVETTSLADRFVLLNPIGVGVKVSDRVVLDFEMVVATAIHPGGVTGLVVDPGVVYNFGSIAVGLRVAWQLNARGNVGMIPLVNVPLVHLGKATWFAEAAFPTFYSDETIAFNTVVHTGVGF